MIETSIIIPVRNNPAWTRFCLEYCILNTDLNNNEIIVVDNNSGLETKNIIKLFESNIVVIENNKNMGSYYAWNQGSEISNGKFLCFLHNDCIVPKNWLPPLINFLKNNKEFGGVFPCTNYSDHDRFLFKKQLLEEYSKIKPNQKNTVSYENIVDLFNSFYPKGIDVFVEYVKENKDRNFQYLDILMSYCYVIYKDLFFDLGKFDTDFYPHLYAENFIKYKMDLNGIYNACFYNSYVHHNGNTTSDGLEFKHNNMLENNKKLFDKKLEYFFNTKQIKVNIGGLTINQINKKDEETTKNLVIRPGGLGDLIMALVVVSSIKNIYPSHLFDYLTFNSYLEVVECFESPKVYGKQLIDHIHVLEDKYYGDSHLDYVWDYALSNFKNEYDNLLNWQDNKIENLITRNTIPRTNLFVENSPYKEVVPHMDSVNISLKTKIIDSICKKIRINKNKKIIVSCLKSNSFYRSFDDIFINKLYGKIINNKNFILINIGSQEIEFKSSDNNFYDLSNKLSPVEQLHLIFLSNLVITVDTAAFHMASVLNKKIISFFGESYYKLRCNYINESKIKIYCREDLSCVVNQCDYCKERPCLNEYNSSEIFNTIGEII